ncbi:uncharacterized protein LOC143575228 [Bidens hawaiensis]|uniref:uncharacterized protein LOC143575228 n=1 Tax=Bidens hawaiensis TaxID=980011 RepID=UPI004049B9EB
MSFVSFGFEPLLTTPRSKLKKSYSVEVANGKFVSIDSVIRNCNLDLNGHKFSINLIPMKLGRFDIIVGMDWLSVHRTEIVCFEKFICMPLFDSQILSFSGEKPFPSSLNLITCFQAQTYLRKKYVAFVAHAVERKERKIEGIPVVREYPEVFPNDVSGLPPTLEVEFRIDLMPGTPITRAPYHLAPSGMQELFNQLQELSDKGLIRPSSSPWGAPVLFSKKKGGSFPFVDVWKPFSAAPSTVSN